MIQDLLHDPNEYIRYITGQIISSCYAHKSADFFVRYPGLFQQRLWLSTASLDPWKKLAKQLCGLTDVCRHVTFEELASIDRCHWDLIPKGIEQAVRILLV